MSAALPIGVFDSGVGGVSVLHALLEAFPRENYIYVADAGFAPYGNRSMEFVEQRVDAIARFFLRVGVKAVVAACNTATNVGIKGLRERYSLPFFGVEPPVKPAVALAGEREVLILCTRLTAEQQKFKALMAAYGTENCTVLPLGALATDIEHAYPRCHTLKDKVHEILTPYPKPAAVVLGCTHYYHVRRLIEEFYGKHVPVLDATGGLIRRIEHVLGDKGLLTPQDQTGGHITYVRW